MPGTLGNHNAMTHGLAAGKLPDGCSYVAKLCKKLRSSLEQACVARHGGVSLTQAATIQSIIRWERHALLCQRWLRVHPGLTAEQQQSMSRDAARASSERDKLLRVLDLDGKDIDPMKALQAEWATWEEQQQATAEPPQPHAIASETPETTSETPASAEGSSEPPTHPSEMPDPDPFAPQS